MSFNAICENKILAKTSESTVSHKLGTLANSPDSGETPHHAVSHQDIHCLLKCK